MHRKKRQLTKKLKKLMTTPYTKQLTSKSESHYKVWEMRCTRVQSLCKRDPVQHQFHRGSSHQNGKHVWVGARGGSGRAATMPGEKRRHSQKWSRRAEQRNWRSMPGHRFVQSMIAQATGSDVYDGQRWTQRNLISKRHFDRASQWRKGKRRRKVRQRPQPEWHEFAAVLRKPGR